MEQQDEAMEMDCSQSTGQESDGSAPGVQAPGVQGCR